MATTDNLPDFSSLFSYNQETGKIFWKINSGRAFIGHEAGTTVTGGYRRVLINKKSYAVHKIVWWFEYGTWSKELDHIDRNKTNNVITNLREATRSENCLNKIIQANNSSGIKGVHYCKTRAKWKVQMRKKGKCTIQRYFETKDEAVMFRKTNEQEYYGEFYRKVNSC